MFTSTTHFLHCLLSGILPHLPRSILSSRCPHLKNTVFRGLPWLGHLILATQNQSEPILMSDLLEMFPKNMWNWVVIKGAIEKKLGIILYWFFWVVMCLLFFSSCFTFFFFLYLQLNWMITETKVMIFSWLLEVWTKEIHSYVCSKIFKWYPGENHGFICMVSHAKSNNFIEKCSANCKKGPFQLFYIDHS